ncbi:hypothetical protein GMORB2_5098 [Geosmithia morbida]|uniref:Uncharacterized protein n=1 Tax=Geosmithia morbida TaxID=1094350 RepID=A0A9P4YZ37_9HYPO|nr:uncharacterized protein GMORB2_5098 [Geosmithia morbida]KAF4124432.1 hypothetical protein GMORB2_5098 [Geosmithia morbida]
MLQRIQVLYAVRCLARRRGLGDMDSPERTAVMMGGSIAGLTPGQSMLERFGIRCRLVGAYDGIAPQVQSASMVMARPGAIGEKCGGAFEGRWPRVDGLPVVGASITTAALDEKASKPRRRQYAGLGAAGLVLVVAGAPCLGVPVTDEGSGVQLRVLRCR